MAQQQRQPVKRLFKTPEGRFQLIAERPNGCSFSSQRPTRLTFAQLFDGQHEALYVIFNVQECLHICYYSATEKVPYRTISFGATPSGALIVPTCHAHTTEGRDTADLLIGLSTGDILVASLQAQLLSSQVNQKLVSFAHFNAEQSVDSTRVIALEWLPQSKGENFVSAHSSGNVYVYQKGPLSTPSSERSFVGRTLSGGGSGGSGHGGGNGARAPLQTLAICDRGLNAMALSPDGQKAATAARDGVVRVHDLASGTLLTGWRTYYGNALCCAWSPDGRWLAAGGEDDLVSLFSMEQQRMVAWGEGHTSWVSALSFDPWAIRPREADAPATPPPPEEEAAPPEGQAAAAADEDSSAVGCTAAEDQQAMPAFSSHPLPPPPPPLLPQQETHAASMQVQAPTAEPELLLRLAAVGHDCNICMWDFPVPQHAPPPRRSRGQSGLEGVTSPFAQPPSQQQQLPPAHSGLGSVGSMRRGWGDVSSPTIRETTSSSPKFLAKLSSGLSAVRGSSNSDKEGPSAPANSHAAAPLQQQQQQAPGHHRSDSSSSGMLLPPEVLPSAKRQDMTFVPALVVQRAHSEPASDLFFMREALFTACHGGSVKCWHRLPKQAAQAPPQAQPQPPLQPASVPAPAQPLPQQQRPLQPAAMPARPQQVPQQLEEQALLDGPRAGSL